MRLHQRSTLVVGALLMLATPQMLLAGHNGHGKDHRRAEERRGREAVWFGGMRVERPSWVMVFGVDVEGRLQLQTESRTGVFVSLDLPSATVYDQVGWGQQGPECAWQLVVISDVPFALPRQFARQEGFRIDRSGHWSALDSRKLSRLLGLRPEAMHVSLCPVVRPGFQAYLYEGGVFSAQVQAGLLCGGQVYIDGRFLGRGAGVLVGVTPGRRRLTVVTEDGRKCSQWVSFPCRPNESNCEASGWVHP
jgi:hypothetical protein